MGLTAEQAARTAIIQVTRINGDLNGSTVGTPFGDFAIPSGQNGTIEQFVPGRWVQVTFDKDVTDPGKKIVDIIPQSLAAFRFPTAEGGLREEDKTIVEEKRGSPEEEILKIVKEKYPTAVRLKMQLYNRIEGLPFTPALVSALLDVIVKEPSDKCKVRLIELISNFNFQNQPELLLTAKAVITPFSKDDQPKKLNAVSLKFLEKFQG